MAERDIIGIGGSAGGIDALRRLLEGIPADFPAAMLVVLHIAPEGPSRLAEMFQRHTPLRVATAADGVRPAPGSIHFAPPDCHLLLHEGRILLGRGPRENRTRPAVDPLFRSLAVARDSRAVGVVLSGRLSDGSSGLRAIVRCGGCGIVQCPDDAGEAEMPKNAIEKASPGLVAPAAEIAGLLSHLVREPAPPAQPVPADIRSETRIAAGRGVAMAPDETTIGRPADISCPECDGPLREISDGGMKRYRCRVGHAYTADALLTAIGEEAERALWVAIRVLEERAEVLRRMAKGSGGGNLAARYTSHADELDADREAIRRILLREPVAGS